MPKVYFGKEDSLLISFAGKPLPAKEWNSFLFFHLLQKSIQKDLKHLEENIGDAFQDFMVGKNFWLEHHCTGTRSKHQRWDWALPYS